MNGVFEDCILCGGRASAFGLFVPYAEGKTGGNGGSSGVSCYRLCFTCVNLPEQRRNESVEVALRVREVGARN